MPAFCWPRRAFVNPYGSLTNCAHLFSFFRRCCRRYSALLALRSYARSLLVRFLIPSFLGWWAMLEPFVECLDLAPQKPNLPLPPVGTLLRLWLAFLLHRSKPFLSKIVCYGCNCIFLCTGPDAVASRMPLRLSSSCI